MFYWEELHDLDCLLNVILGLHSFKMALVFDSSLSCIYARIVDDLQHMCAPQGHFCLHEGWSGIKSRVKSWKQKEEGVESKSTNDKMLLLAFYLQLPLCFSLDLTLNFIPLHPSCKQTCPKSKDND
eukprot:TRINITY_DN6688_c0_g7_i1.p1 TRINITY_DN6688_c0_g7~~TRINITY_DN6688_c0_g7_i1.p1  ORF type:complete len:126 (-),score=9.12 TRINITY_DN6688_c0_g7_i1:159-536(-)